MSQREKKGYARKREQGLVPFFYDKDSRKFLEGASRHWTGERKRDEQMLNFDRETLRLARER